MGILDDDGTRNLGDKPDENPGLAHRIGIGTDGFYQGVIKMAAAPGIAVDILNAGIKAVGLPASQNPVGGNKWIKEKLTTAYEGYNNLAGVTVPKPVDKTDVLIHGAADLAGQIAIPATAAISKTAMTVGGLKDLAITTKNAASYTTATEDAVSTAGQYSRGVKSAASVAAASGGIKTTATPNLQSSFASANSAAQIAAAAPSEPAPQIMNKNSPSLS